MQMNSQSEDAFADKWPVRSREFDPKICFLALGTFAIGTDAYVISGILAAVAQDLHVGVNAAGQLVSWFSFTYAIAAPVLAAFVGHLKRQNVIVGALLMFAAANAVCAISTSFEILIAARVVAAIASGLYTPTAFTLAAALAAPEKKSKALAVVALGLTSATALGVPIGVVTGQRAGWHGTFWLVVALSLVAVVAIRLARLPSGDATLASSPGLAARFKPLTHGSTLLALLPAVAIGSAYFLTYTYLGAILAAQGFPARQIVAVFLASGIGGVLGSLAGGQLGVRFRPIVVLVVTFTVLGIDAALLAFSMLSLWSAALSLSILSGSGWLFLPVQQARLLKIVEAHHAQFVMALNNSCIYLGSAAGTAIGAALIRAGVGLPDLHWASAVLACVALVTLVLSYLRSGQ
jgi:MFS transporter, DHA1 family, inner membrane transport protein